MVKNEGIFMPFWLKHYSKTFEPQDMYVHSDGSTDDTEGQVRAAGANLITVPPGTIPVGKNDRYVKPVITELLQRYECVLFAESPDDIIVPGPAHGHDLRRYIDEFVLSTDRYRFLTGVNIIQGVIERPYNPTRGTLLSQRSFAIRCPQYDNAFLWKDTPLWGRGWHDLGGKRLEGMGDNQGEDKRLYNLHIHYADFALCNRRHHARQATFTPEQRAAYASYVDAELFNNMCRMLDAPREWFSNGAPFVIEPWMKEVV
jgi:hypothetical protein